MRARRWFLRGRVIDQFSGDAQPRQAAIPKHPAATQAGPDSQPVNHITIGSTWNALCSGLNFRVRRSRLPASLLGGLAAAWALVLAPTGEAAFGQVTARPVPTTRTSDELNVDITTGLPYWTVPDVGIGPRDPSIGLHHATNSYLGSYSTPHDSFWGGIVANSTGGPCNQVYYGLVSYEVIYAGTSECFRQSGSVWTSNAGRGTSFEVLGGGLFLYTLADGTKVYISSAYRVATAGSGAVTQVTAPDGLITRIYYDAGGGPSGQFSRIRFVARNNGYRLYYRYASNDPLNGSWLRPSSVVAFNAAHVACDVTQTSCTVAGSWPTATYSRTASGNVTTFSITDAGGRTTRFKHDLSLDQHFRVTSIQLPTSTVDNYTYTYCPQDPTCYYLPSGAITPIAVRDMVVRATRNGQVWEYGMSPAGPYNITRNSTGPTGLKITMLSNLQGHLYWVRGPEASYNYSGSEGDILGSVGWPQGNSTQLYRDSRGNIVETRHVPDTGSGLSSISEFQTFPPTCANRITCNRPTSLTDGRGNTTHYEYDPVHGGVVRAWGPTVNGVEWETRYTYVQRHASYLNGAGAVVADADPVWLPLEERSCRTGAASGTGCAIAGDEVAVRYEYGPTTGINNLLLRGVVREADGVTTRTCYGYDRYGNRISETSPGAGLTSCP